MRSNRVAAMFVAIVCLSARFACSPARGAGGPAPPRHASNSASQGRYLQRLALRGGAGACYSLCRSMLCPLFCRVLCCWKLIRVHRLWVLDDIWQTGIDYADMSASTPPDESGAISVSLCLLSSRCYLSQPEELSDVLSGLPLLIACPCLVHPHPSIFLTPPSRHHKHQRKQTWASGATRARPDPHPRPCMHSVLPVHSIREGQHQPWEWTEARMGVRLLERAMLGPLVVAAINYDFVGTN